MDEWIPVIILWTYFIVVGYFYGIPSMLDDLREIRSGTKRHKEQRKWAKQQLQRKQSSSTTPATSVKKD